VRPPNEIVQGKQKLHLLSKGLKKDPATTKRARKDMQTAYEEKHKGQNLAQLATN